MLPDSKIVIDVVGRPSPWANQPHEGEWRNQIAFQTQKLSKPPFEKEVKPTRVLIEYRLIASRKGDLDNLAKPVLDTLFQQSRSSKFPTGCLFKCDDCHISELVLRKVIVASPELEGATIVIEF